jgi:hypothetical protein
VIKLLRRFLDWLEMRFPAKVVLTEKMFNDVERDISRIDDVIMVWDSRITNCERHYSELQKSIDSLKEGIVKGDIRPALTDAQKQRQEFVEGNFSRTRVTRQELENLAKK